MPPRDILVSSFGISKINIHRIFEMFPMFLFIFNQNLTKLSKLTDKNICKECQHYRLGLN